MKITELVLHPIAIADPPLRSSYGLHAPFALRTIVELKTDSGLTGFSETYGGDGPLAGLESVRARVVGMDPFQLAALWRDLSREAEHAMANAPGGRSQTYLVPGENPLDRHARTFAAIEIACLDLIGKATGKPVCDVIGGRVRDEVSFSAYLFYKHGGGGGIGDDVREDEYGEVLSAEACVRECRQMTAQYGFREIKLKGGVLDPQIEIESIRALRARVRAAGSAAHRPQLRVERGHHRKGGSRAQGRARRRRLPGRRVRHVGRHGRGAAAAAGRGQPHAAGEQCGGDVFRGRTRLPGNWTRCRSCSATRTTGAECAMCSSSRI